MATHLIRNPHRHMPVLANSYQLIDELGLPGQQLFDDETSRIWTVIAVYAPRSVTGGVRIKLNDNRGFVSFLEQEDYEVIFDMVQPGDICPWSGRKYAGPGDRDWNGLYADDFDLKDDLYDRHQEFVRIYNGYVPTDALIQRCVHSENRDFLESWGYLPSLAGHIPITADNVDTAWVRVESMNVKWEEIARVR